MTRLTKITNGEDIINPIMGESVEGKLLQSVCVHAHTHTQILLYCLLAIVATVADSTDLC